MQSGQATINLLQIKLQQKSASISYKVTNDCNKKTGKLGGEALSGLLIENVHCTN
jgi:hypothetical protein